MNKKGQGTVEYISVLALLMLIVYKFMVADAQLVFYGDNNEPGAIVMSAQKMVLGVTNAEGWK